MRTPRVWGWRAARLAALQRGPRGEGTRTAMGASAYENGRRDRCRPHQLTLSFGIRYASSSPYGRRRYAAEAWSHPCTAPAAQDGPDLVRGRFEWGRTRTPQGTLAPQAGGEHGLPLPTLSLAVSTNRPKASTLRGGPRGQPAAAQAAPHRGPDPVYRLAACSVSSTTPTRIGAQITSFAQKRPD